MIVVVTDSVLSYKDDVRSLRDDFGAVVREMHPDQSESEVRSKWSFLPPLLLPNVRKYRKAWNAGDDVIAIGWYVIPILLLMKLRLVKRPAVVLSYGTFIQSATFRRILMMIFRVLKNDRTYIISSSSIEDEDLQKVSHIDASHRFVMPFRETAGLDASASTGEEFVFAGGFTNRDYDTFLAAVADIDFPVLIAAAERNGLSQQLPHVTIRTDVDPGAFERDIARSRAVVLPLNPGGGGSGQSVLLTAIRHEKPLVVTRHPAIVDMLGPDFAGYVEPGSVDSMRSAISRCLTDPEFEQQLCNASAQARATIAKWLPMPDEMMAIIKRVHAAR